MDFRLLVRKDVRTMPVSGHCSWDCGEGGVWGISIQATHLPFFIIFFFFRFFSFIFPYFIRWIITFFSELHPPPPPGGGPSSLKNSDRWRIFFFLRNSIFSYYYVGYLWGELWINCYNIGKFIVVLGTFWAYWLIFLGVVRTRINW